MTLRNFSSTAAETTLATGVDASTSTLVVSATTGFPSPPFTLAVDAGVSAQELVLVTNVAGTNLTVTRGYDSTVAVAHGAGAVIAHSHGAIDFREANSHVNDSTGVHGTTGSVVGTSDTQTLTNKTVSLGSNTVTGTLAQFNAALTDGDFATLAGAETLSNKTLSAPGATGSLAGFGSAYSTHSPTVTASSGSITTVSGSTRYNQVGKTVTYHTVIDITDAGTGAGALLFTLPVAPHSSVQVLGSGQEPQFGAGVIVARSSDKGSIIRYDGSTTIRNGTVVVSGSYEAA